MMEPFDKVILYGTFDGLNLSSDGSRDILVTLENGDRVDIHEYLVRKASNFVEKDKLKLKDVIARIKELDLVTQKVWLNEILNELGSDYGSLKYRAGYEQGKFDGAMEREKVTVPQFVADWYEKNKDDFDYIVWECIYHDGKGKQTEMSEWICQNENAIITLVNMHQFGYTVEKEKWYLVKMKGISVDSDYLNYDSIDDEWYLASDINGCNVRTHHTRKELEEAGFGWVFDCPGMEVEEVE